MQHNGTSVALGKAPGSKILIRLRFGPIADIPEFAVHSAPDVERAPLNFGL